ncbi:glucose-6-phosphate isomerase [Desulfosarcina ovata subsp. sediminis]|uniref:Glucose-6-phosphate isomerase n=1 Tax=Desulfosarcina ovata subsp. sediminis TaxID=885957 RepID=A0A5K7ZDH8_9BACT|nr:glucose-6-phosphate isomerase [Desulfosarcina ovata]BBO80052.1 glucose-6-phosphate isomerase [Desulfosarcina ovata subsp. sediminis]
MAEYRFDEHELHGQLVIQARKMSDNSTHLKNLIADESRLASFSVNGGGLFFDYSRQRVDKAGMQLLFELAEESGARDRFARMAAGEKVNVTENRAALHMAARSFADVPIMLDGRDARAELMAVLDKIRTFTNAVHRGEVNGSDEQKFKHVVVVGIGGSYLGTEFVASALEAFADRDIQLDFLANVDIHNFGAIWARIDPRRTLWIIISKSYTTAETMANEDLIRRYMTGYGLDPAKHIVTVTSKGSPGDQGGGREIAAFHMFDFIGGRYSVTSAVGGVPLSLYLGYDRFERFLKGAEMMDRHALDAPAEQNLPLIAALLTVWNTSFLGYPQSAIIPYASPLSKLAPHVQQLNMESNGKSVDAAGRFLVAPAGTVIFGEPGTNAQHSFFQLAHQGKPFPVEFIGVLNPQYRMDEGCCKGVGHQQELWANLLAQATALAIGRENDDPAKYFSGNRPSSILVIEDLEPESVGRLLAFYEAKTVYEAFIWGINPFDQFGVELGKVTAGTLRKAMAVHNDNPADNFSGLDPINRRYLQMLSSGKLID